LAILIRHLLDSEKIQVDQQAVNRRFQMTCSMIDVNPEELIKEAYGRQIYQETQSIMTEETVLDYIIEKAQAS
jgi:FKBP-type peptidyl-prolyl cis-trans isomerase (trigger factor)